MSNENVTVEDLKATATAKLEDAQNEVQNKIEDAKSRFNALPDNKKFLVVGAAAAVGALIVQKIVERVRNRNAEPPIHVDTVVVNTVAGEEI